MATSKKAGKSWRSLESKSRWYVYELTDPRNSAPFYIGKGCGNRIDFHEKQADSGFHSHKTAKIKSIKNDGLEIIKTKVAFFWDEQSAYDFETTLIEEIGLDNLTNAIPGGQVAWSARIEEMKARHNSIMWARLVTQTENLNHSFARWISAHQNGEVGFNVIADENQLLVVKACAVSYFPQAWKAIKKSVAALRIVSPVFERHGLVIQYG